MGSFDIITLIFLALAVFVIFKLRSVLGERTGAEPPPPENLRRDTVQAPARDEKIITLPSRNTAPVEDVPDETVFRWQGFAQEGSALAEGFDAIAALDSSFQPASFGSGAKAAYEMIVTAFNNGDRKALKNLLSREIFDAFSQDITEREARGETVQSNFVSLDKADIVDASVRGRIAQVTVRFVSQMITVTRDKAGDVVDGSVDRIVNVTDTWTFTRDTATKDPNWRLVATGDGE